MTPGDDKPLTWWECLAIVLGVAAMLAAILLAAGTWSPEIFL